MDWDPYLEKNRIIQNKTFHGHVFTSCMCMFDCSQLERFCLVRHLFQWPRPYIKDVIAYCKKHGLVKILGQQENAANSGQHIELLLLYP